MLRKNFHFYHLMSAYFSMLMYLLLSSVNTIATSWGMSFFLIGVMNFTGASAYITTSFLLGRYGDKKGHKRMLSIAMLVFCAFDVLFLFLRNVPILFAFVIGTNVFFGFFFPQVEGLLSKQEKRLGVNAVNTITKFNLSWSTGNIFGVIFGPFMVTRARWSVFALSFTLSLLTFAFLVFDLKRNGESIKFTPSFNAKKKIKTVDFPHISTYRFVYRLTLILSGLVYAAFLSLFPKLSHFSGVPLSVSGLLAAGANIGVLMTFFTFSRVHSWVAEPFNALLFMGGFPVLVFLLFLPQTPLSFFFVALTAGVTYAVPYTYAIFYALNSPREDHGKQGGFHEATIGTLSAFGPLVGGTAVQFAQSMRGLAYMAFILFGLVLTIQFVFLRKVKKWNVDKA